MRWAWIALMLLVAGCGKPAADTKPSSPPPISVTTVRAQQKDVPVTLEATGTVTALNSVEIRPQTSSTIAKVHIAEGQFVKSGQLLFTLDNRTDQTNLTKAQAQLAKDAATLKDAQRQLNRSRELLAQKFVSQGALDTAQAQVDAQNAVVQASRAAIQAAQVAVADKRITAPAAGRAGAINVFAGSLVQPTGTALVTITQLNPIGVSFNVPQRQVADALAALRRGDSQVTALVAEGVAPLAGQLQFVDNAVDASSGTVRVKARFDNPQSTLWPGAFVPVRLALRTLSHAVVVPQAAIIQSPRGAIVYVVGADNKAAARKVEVVHTAGVEAVVSGVNAGDTVVLEGRQNLRAGSLVVQGGASSPQIRQKDNRR
jgi:RND family efflux transporter MFP subunit